MRITFVVPALNLSGGIRVSVDYAKRLSAFGHEVTLVWPVPWQEPLYRRIKQRLIAPFSESMNLTKTEPLNRSFIDQDMCGCRLIQCRTDRVLPSDVPDADVVVATWWTAVEWMSAFPERKGKKVHFIQGDDTETEGLEELTKAAWRHPMARIIVAPWLREVVNGLLGDVPTQVVLNGVDVEHFCVPPRSKQPVARVGYLYSSARIKGCDVIAKALELARRRLPNLQLLSFGAEAPTGAMPLATDATYTLKPPQDSIRDIYASCDVWLWGSRREGFGLPLLEAMACRTPVVATSAGAASELVAQGGGALVPVEDASAMAAALIEFCEMTPNQWLEHSSVAHHFALTRSTEVAAREFLSALERIVRRSD